ncbi:hypothetical protein BJ508DRAFT_175773 [Ascobolus immersus RN42]|uniref:Uncharacterized protein n=1 Tax=Ascobolus immersus RN42 TaxID=1160509 RepID=A0A3N4HYI0_ASCIM|nr:hypothetical protein BJ508DRAFT_175773 [Ascobolus immersus RN42]
MSAEVQKAPAAHSAPHKHGRKESVSNVPHLFTAEEAKEKNITVLPHDFSKDKEPLGWKINTAPQTSETLGKELLTYYADTFATEPPMGKVHIKIGVGIDLKVSKATKGVRVKDVIEAIYTKYGKKFSEDPEDPYLVGFVYDTDDEPGTLTAVLKKESPVGHSVGGGKKKKSKDKSEKA